MCRASAVLLISAGILPGFAASTPQYTIEARVLPDYQFLVPVLVNQAGPFWCNFDSGAGSVFAIEPSAAEEAGLHPTTTGHSSGEGSTVVSDQRLSGVMLQLGQLRIADRTVTIRPLGAAIQCVFGTAILARYAVQVDFAASAVRLFDPQTFDPGPRAARVAVTFAGNTPTVAARLILKPGDTIDMKLAVDTGASQWPLLVSKRFTDKNGLLNRARRVVEPAFQATATGGTLALLATRADRLTVGPFGVSDPVVMLSRTERALPVPWDGNLGSECLRRFLLTIDYPQRLLFLEPNRDFDSPPEPYDGSGLWIRGIPGNFVIQKVADGTPAARSGLQTGDVLLSLDGVASSDLTLNSIHEKLFRSQGQRTLGIKRGMSQLVVILNLAPLL